MAVLMPNSTVSSPTLNLHTPKREERKTIEKKQNCKFNLVLKSAELCYLRIFAITFAITVTFVCSQESDPL